MKLFRCSACGNLVFFENVRCTQCGHSLAYLPELGCMSALEPVPDAPGSYLALEPAAKRARYRLCGNSVQYAVCNWAIPETDATALCMACRFNSVIPNLAAPGAQAAWHRLEIAKRRLFETLDALHLPVEPRATSPRGLAFAFKQDVPGGDKILTGHADGLITINIAEADAPFREHMREEMNETYRTVLGHFRHEIGHYYWSRLVADGPELAPFRAKFGDERADYSGAAARHYASGPPADWTARFVSAYASMHPWEDWAETWAHYLHMVDTLETARSYGLALRPAPVGGGAAPAEGLALVSRRLDFDDFDDLMRAWVPLTLALNSLNRSMGLADPYPFVLSAAAIAKLRFVHEVIERAAATPSASAAPVAASAG